MGRMRRQNPDWGYALDFAGPYLASSYPEIAAKSIKIVANAGGVNSKACAAALKLMATSMGLSPKIALVEGDDLLDLGKSMAQDILDFPVPVPAALLQGQDKRV